MKLTISLLTFLISTHLYAGGVDTRPILTSFGSEINNHSVREITYETAQPVTIVDGDFKVNPIFVKGVVWEETDGGVDTVARLGTQMRVQVRAQTAQQTNSVHNDNAWTSPVKPAAFYWSNMSSDTDSDTEMTTTSSERLESIKYIGETDEAVFLQINQQDTVVEFKNEDLNKVKSFLKNVNFSAQGENWIKIK